MSEKDRIERVIGSVPLNRTATRVVGGGAHYEPDGKIGEHHTYSENPLPIIPIGELKEKGQVAAANEMIGKRWGRMVVVGYGGNTEQFGARWVCRCACGAYEYRRTKTVRRARPEDRCIRCEQIEYRKRRYQNLGAKSDQN